MASTDTVPRNDHRPLRILFVDDNPLECRTASKMLSYFGHQVVTVQSAEQGLDLLKQDSFDLVVTDWDLPGGADGLFMASRIRFEKPDVPVIVCSGKTKELGPEAKRSGACDFIPKPFTADELNDICSKAVAEAARKLALDEVNQSTDAQRNHPTRVERELILAALKETDGHLGRAATILGFSYSKMQRKMKQLGIEKEFK